ncbi:MAG: branched-chain amino acid ABC transporter substrate-binding protein [Actinomycetota bacterium]
MTLIFGACAQEEAGQDRGGTTGKPEYKIALMGDLTGSTALLIVGQNKAARVAIKEVNDDEDFPVRIKLQSEDTQGDADKAVPLAQKLAADDKVLAIVGPGFSGESFSANPIIQQAGIPQVTPSATNPGLSQQGWKSWWRALGNDNSQGGPAPDVALKYLGAKKVFVAHDNTPYGKGLAEIVRNRLNETDSKVLAGFEGIEPDKEDYGALATKLANSKADVFFYGGYSPEAGKIIKQARDRGYQGKLLAGDGAKDGTFTKGSGEQEENSYFLCPCADLTASDDPMAKEFADKYKDQIGEEVTVYSSEGYDATRIILEAIRKAGRPGSDIKAYRAKVAGNIRSVKDFKGTSKVYNWQPNGELVDESVVINLFRHRNGKFEFIGPAEEVVKEAASPGATGSPAATASPGGTASP